MGQLTQNFVDLAMATCKEGRHPSLTVWEAQQLLHAWNDREALRARVATLEGDLSVARLQLGARVCSECPAKARVAELEFALHTLRDAAETSDDARYGTLGTGFVRHVIDGVLRLSGNKPASLSEGK